MIVGVETTGEIKKVRALDVPPPGEGLRTDTVADPAKTISPDAIEADKWVLLTKVVERLRPFQVTIESEINFEPVTARVKPSPPALAELGLSPLTAGTGLLIRSAKALVVLVGVG